METFTNSTAILPPENVDGWLEASRVRTRAVSTCRIDTSDHNSLKCRLSSVLVCRLPPVRARSLREYYLSIRQAPQSLRKMLVLDVRLVSMLIKR